MYGERNLPLKTHDEHGLPLVLRACVSERANVRVGEVLTYRISACYCDTARS